MEVDVSGGDVNFWEGRTPRSGGPPGSAEGSKARRPLEPGYIHVPDDPGGSIQLIASYSPGADTYYFPRR